MCPTTRPIAPPTTLTMMAPARVIPKPRTRLPRISSRLGLGRDQRAQDRDGHVECRGDADDQPEVLADDPESGVHDLGEGHGADLVAHRPLPLARALRPPAGARSQLTLFASLPARIA